MDFSKYKLQKYLTETAPMGSVQVANAASNGAKDQIQPTRDRKSVQSRQTAKKPVERTMSGQMFAQDYIPDYDQYFKEMNAEKKRIREFNEQKSDWRQELLQEKAVDGVEREQHPFVTVMPTGDENLIQAMKQMGGEVKDKKDKVKAAAGGGEDVQEGKRGLWDNIHAKRKRGESPAKKGDKDYPKTLNVEGKKEEFVPEAISGEKVDKMRDQADFEFKKPAPKKKLDLKDIKNALKEAKKSDCKDGYKWDSEKKKCVKKTGSSSSRYYGVGIGLYPGHDHDDDDKGDSNGGGDSGGGDGGGMGEMFDFLGKELFKEKSELSPRQIQRGKIMAAARERDKNKPKKTPGEMMDIATGPRMGSNFRGD